MTVNVVVLQARTSSSRLPGKALLGFRGMPLAVLAAKRAANSGLRVILATSNASSDDVLATEAHANGVEVFRGQLDDVLGRFVLALDGMPDETLVTRLTGDNIVPDGQLVDVIAEEFLDRDLDYITTTAPQTGLPYGISIEITRLGHLRVAARNALTAFEREHVTTLVIAEYGLTGVKSFVDFGMQNYRATIDCLDDYLSMQRVFPDVADPVSVPWVEIAKRLDHGLYQPMWPEPLSSFVMGTVQLGLTYGVSQGVKPDAAERQTMIKTAIGNGVVWLDTAGVYGESENVIGATLATGWQGRCRIVTKLLPMTDLPDDAPESTVNASVEASVLQSCLSLRTGQLDTVLLHRASHLTQWNGAVWKQLTHLKADGRVNRIGVSIQTPQELRLAISIPEVEHVQIPCNILDHRWGDFEEVLTARKTQGTLTVHARSLLLQGLLLSTDPDNWRRAGVEAPEGVIEWLRSTCDTCGRESLADLCLAWARSQNWIDGLVIGTDNMVQLTENMRIFSNLKLSTSQLDLIATTRPILPDTALDPAQWHMDQS